MEVLISLYCLFRRFRGVRHNSCSVTMVWSECQVSLIGHLETLLSTDVYKASPQRFVRLCAGAPS